MLDYIDKKDFIDAYLNLDGKVVVEFYDYADQADGSTFRFVEQREYAYSMAIVQDLDELFGFDLLDNINDPHDIESFAYYQWEVR